MGKTCLVYRYLYNTFGETISVRRRARGRRERARLPLAQLALAHTRCPDRRCSPPLQTIGASFAMKKIEANGRPCNLGIWVRRCLPSPRAVRALRVQPSPPPRSPVLLRRTRLVRSASTRSRASTAGERAPPSSVLI